MDLLAEPTVRSTLERGRQAYVAVASPAGPHVTPELYSVADGRLWCWTAATTVKAKVVADDGRVGAVVTTGSRSVVLTGTATRYDLGDPRSLPRALRDPKALATATLRFGLRNAADLGGFATDLVSGRLGRSLPPRRIVMGITPERVAVVDAGRVELAEGDWPGTPEAGTTVTDGRREAVLAWETDDGPVALPGRVDPAEHVAWVAPALAALADLPSPARIGVVVDEYGAPGPAAKAGTLLRGTARLDPSGRVEVEPERETEWQGVATRTKRAG
jgi:hypothetical protein